jgi:hypothetical protein
MWKVSPQINVKKFCCLVYLKGDFLYFSSIQHCFVCRPSDSTVSEDAGFRPRTVAIFVRRSNTARATVFSNMPNEEIVNAGAVKYQEILFICCKFKSLHQKDVRQGNTKEPK